LATRKRLIEENLCKGEELLVEGELDQREWTNKESQKQEHRTQVDLQQYTVLRRRQGGGQTSARPAAVVQPRPEDDPWANNSPDSEPPF
jgi:single-stranded DNA-binding protein